MSLGNDVISIAHLIERTGDRKQRYYEKTYTENEIRLIETLNMKYVEGFFWALKESAYKAYFRINPKQIVSPKKFEVLAFDGVKATVKTPVGIMDSVVEANENYIHGVTFQSPLPPFQKGNSPLAKGVGGVESIVFQFGKNFHQEVKTIIAKKLHCNIEEVEIIKDKNNVPTLKVENQHYLLSLSHDYNWGAYAYQNVNKCTKKQA
ncbi:MAG: 4'-phosphopantetheinyl transferase superfamily protein [Flavobacteriales bacterium]|nr:4'-phosphopantetheinyl transferase superfamily protein [Flavobacteriales bacterium]